MSQTSKTILSLITAAIVVGGGFYCWQNNQSVKEPDTTTQPSSNESDLKTYSSENYSFKYPEGYFVVTHPSGIILTVRKAASQKEADALGNDAVKNRLEIFQMEDFGERPWGFEGDETQEDIDDYVPKDLLTVSNGDEKYDVWIYYSEEDTETKNELMQIFESIEIHANDNSTSSSKNKDALTNWQTYRDQQSGFQIKYPENWGYIKNNNGVCFGLTYGPDRCSWSVNIYESGKMEELIKATGSQFEGRKETRSEVKINENITGTMATVTTDANTDWISKTVYIEGNKKLYAIGNGAVDDDRLETFYKSFELITDEKPADSEQN